MGPEPNIIREYSKSRDDILFYSGSDNGMYDGLANGSEVQSGESRVIRLRDYSKLPHYYLTT